MKDFAYSITIRYKKLSATMVSILLNGVVPIYVKNVPTWLFCAQTTNVLLYRIHYSPRKTIDSS
jgi:hypothetical protein